MGQTVVEKIAERHLADGPPARPVRTGDFVAIRPHHVMTHDNTAAVMNKFRGLGAKSMHRPGQPVFTLDHDIQNRSDANLTKYKNIEAFAKEMEVDFHPAGSGIGHQLMVENGFVKPGGFMVASDSHSNMYGGLGCVGTPIVRTDAAAAWATGTFWWQVPSMVKVLLEGKLRPGVTGKDVIVTLCGLYNQGEVLNAAVEFTGSGVAGLSIASMFLFAIPVLFPGAYLQAEERPRVQVNFQFEGRLFDRITTENRALIKSRAEEKVCELAEARWGFLDWSNELTSAQSAAVWNITLSVEDRQIPTDSGGTTLATIATLRHSGQIVSDQFSFQQTEENETIYPLGRTIPFTDPQALGDDVSTQIGNQLVNLLESLEVWGFLEKGLECQ